jgi:hypothetical protein
MSADIVGLAVVGVCHKPPFWAGCWPLAATSFAAFAAPKWALRAQLRRGCRGGRWHRLRCGATASRSQPAGPRRLPPFGGALAGRLIRPLGGQEANAGCHDVRSGTVPGLVPCGGQLVPRNRRRRGLATLEVCPGGAPAAPDEAEHLGRFRPAQGHVRRGPEQPAGVGASRIPRARNPARFQSFSSCRWLISDAGPGETPSHPGTSRRRTRSPDAPRGRCRVRARLARPVPPKPAQPPGGGGSARRPPGRPRGRR